MCMFGKWKIFIFISFIAFLTSVAFKDDKQEIRQIVHSSIVYPAINVVHIEQLDHDQAIAFYEWDSAGQRHFGRAFLKKSIFGWTYSGASSSYLSDNHSFSWSFSNLAYHFSGYTGVLSGKILDPDIEEIQIVTPDGNNYSATIIEYSPNQKLWFIISDHDELVGSTIIAQSAEGETIEQFY